MRGAISLAAALSITEGVEGRAEVIFLTFVVILVTLVGQGLTLPALIRALRLPDSREWSPAEAVARLEAAQSALDRLDELEEEAESTRSRYGACATSIARASVSAWRCSGARRRLKRCRSSGCASARSGGS